MPNCVHYPNGETRFYCPTGCGYWSPRREETAEHEKTHYEEPLSYCVYCHAPLSNSNFSGICRDCKRKWKNRGTCFRCGRTYYLGPTKHPKYSFCPACSREVDEDYSNVIKTDRKCHAHHAPEIPLSEMAEAPMYRPWPR